MSPQPSALSRAVLVMPLGLAVGVLYTFSPLTVCCLVWTAVLFRWTATDVGGRERRWLLAALGAAFALRVMAIAILPFLVDPRRQAYTSYFGDAQYAIQRSIWIRNVFLHIPVAPRDYVEAFEPEFGWSGYNYLLAFFHVVFGPSPYGVALLSTALFLTASAILYRLCRNAFGPLAALGGLIALLFLPSWFGWSVVPMREAMQFLLLTAATVAAVALAGPRWGARMLAMAGLVGAIFLTATLRGGAAWIATIAVGLGASLWLVTRRWWAVVGFALLLPPMAVWALNTPRIQSAVAAAVTDAALRHLGNVRMPGFAYKILDDQFYADAAKPSGGAETIPLRLTRVEAARFLVRATVAFFVMPVPSALDMKRWLSVVPLQVEWGILLLLGVFGVIAGVRRHALLTYVLLGFVVAGVVVMAPNSGNVGTLIRHRDAISPFLAALAGIGGTAVARTLIGHHALNTRAEDSLRPVSSWR